MKRILIYTIQSMNYGNRLQNYAVQELLRDLGFETYTVYTRKFKNYYKYIFEVIKKKIKGLFLYNIYTNYDKFNSKIQYTSYKEYIESEHTFTGEYDYYIVGSDQVWNTNFDFITINSFLPNIHSNKISLSASFGVDSIPYDKEIGECLNEFKAISVREEAGAKIIKNFINRDATVLVDPTLLISRDRWKQIARKPKGVVDNEFILTYFLSPKCKSAHNTLLKLKKDKKVYELLNSDDSVACNAGPMEFLWLFEHADLILTDSFHACVFSFIFNKPFLVYDRNWNEGNMNSRLETFLTKFNLQRKYVDSGLFNDIWEHDYTDGYNQLKIEKDKATAFLMDALED